jgi:hypothetical protein
MTEYCPLVIFGTKSVGMLHGADIGGMHIDPPNGPNPTYKDIYLIH